MKTAKILLTGIAISLTYITACRKDNLKPDPLPDDKMEKTVAIPQDSLETMYMMQSNPELMLADRIISKNAVFYLDISQEEARELNISNELYQKYQNRVREMNNTPAFDKKIDNQQN